MKIDKPFEWSEPGNFPWKHWMNYKWEERKTDKLIYMQCLHLPCPDIYEGRLNTSQDPKDYDLIYHSEIPPEQFLKYGVLPNNGVAPLVREDVLTLLEDLCPGDFQAFPVTIVPEKPKKIGDFEDKSYYLLNILNEAVVFDDEKCKFSYLPTHLTGKIYGVDYMVLREASSLLGHHIVREKRLHTNIFVSPELVALFKKHKIKGIDFWRSFE